MQSQIINYNSQEEFEEDLSINFKKYFMIFHRRKLLMFFVFTLVLAIFIGLTYVIPKVYKIDADLYINKTNNTHISDINPFVIDETGGNIFAMGSDKAMNNELELIKSPLVIDKVIRENNLRYKKLFGIIKTRKTGEYLSTEKFLKKNVSFENKKNTNVIEIIYKSKDPQQSYNVVSSIINNYIELHKEINTYKSKSDKNIIESEYNRVKSELNKSVNAAGGLPSNAVSGAGNLAALSAFSKTASRAVGNIKGQYLASERARVDISEKAAKVNSLSEKLEWAKLVDDMSDTSKVLVIKEPVKLRDFENSSPKLLINIVLGIIFGIFASLFVPLFKDMADKKVSYSILGDNIIYNDDKAFFNINKFLVDYNDKNITCILFEKPEQNISELLSKFKNVNVVNAEISTTLVNNIKKSDYAILLCKIGKTDSDIYKSIKETIQILNKQILKEVLI